MANKIPFVKGDEVRVIAGKDRETPEKKRRGVINRVFPESGRVVVSQINIVKKCTRANQQRGRQGGILEREAPLHHSNVQLICPSCREPTTIVFKRAEAGNKSRRIRICKKCGAGVGEAKQ